MANKALPFDMSPEQVKAFESMAQAGRLVGEIQGVFREYIGPSQKSISAMVVQVADGQQLKGVVPADLRVEIGKSVAIVSKPDAQKHVIVTELVPMRMEGVTNIGRGAVKHKIVRRARDRKAKAAAGVLADTIEQSLKAARIAAESVVPYVSPQMASGVQATENAWRDMALEHGMLTSREVAELLGSDAKNPSDFVADQRSRGKIIGVPRRNALRYPGYQFRNGEVLPAISRLIEVANQYGVPLPELAQWICIPTRQLGGERPVDHLDEVERVVAAADGHYGVQW